MRHQTSQQQADEMLRIHWERRQLRNALVKWVAPQPYAALSGDLVKRNVKWRIL
jgi:hypothetical protein